MFKLMFMGSILTVDSFCEIFIEGETVRVVKNGISKENDGPINSELPAALVQEIDALGDQVRLAFESIEPRRHGLFNPNSANQRCLTFFSKLEEEGVHIKDMVSRTKKEFPGMSHSSMYAAMTSYKRLVKDVKLVG